MIKVLIVAAVLMPVIGIFWNANTAISQDILDADNPMVSGRFDFDEWMREANNDCVQPAK